MRNLANAPPSHIKSDPIVAKSTLSRHAYIKLYYYLLFSNGFSLVAFLAFIALILLSDIKNALCLPSFVIPLSVILLGSYIVYGVASTLHHAHSPRNETLFLPPKKDNLASVCRITCDCMQNYLSNTFYKC